MDCIFGITGKDYVIIASDKNIANSIVKLQDDDEKIISIGETQLLGSSAEVSTRKSFSRLIKANLQYNYFRYNNKLLTKEVASFTRNMIWESLRSRNPYQVANIIAGFDDGEPNLYLIEQLGGMEKVTRGAIGYSSYFLLGLMDSYYKKDMSLEDGLECISKCIFELKTRFLINLVGFDVYLIDKNGVQNISESFNEKKK